MAVRSFDAAGVTVEYLLKKVNEFLDNKETLYYANVVLDSKEVDDTVAKTHALHLASRIHGIYTLQVDVNGDVRHTHTLDFSNVTEEGIEDHLVSPRSLPERLTGRRR
jgi:hypothetical protein